MRFFTTHGLSSSWRGRAAFVLALIGLTSLCVPRSAQALWPPEPFTTLLSAGSTTCRLPDISGHVVVWQTDGTWADNWPADSSLRSFDLATGVVRRIAPAPWRRTAPRISGTKVAFNDFRDGDSDVCVFDRRTGSTARIAYSSRPETIVDMAEARWVLYWRDLGRTSYRTRYDLRVRDLVSGAQSLVATVSVMAGPPSAAISGTTVAYETGGVDGRDASIRTFDVVTRRSRLVGRGNDIRLTASGSTVVWKASRYADRYDPGTDESWQDAWDQLWRYNMSTGKSQLVREVFRGDSRNEAQITDPVLSGTLLFYAGGPCPRELHGLDLATMRNVVYGGYSGVPTGASGTWAVLAAQQNAGSQIYLYETRTFAHLGIPVTPSVMSTFRTYRITGRLYTKHAEGADAGKLICQRYYSGAWHTSRRFSITVHNSSTTQALYRTGLIRIPNAGRWRFRAWHYCSRHASSFSRWRYVTVK